MSFKASDLLSAIDTLERSLASSRTSVPKLFAFSVHDNVLTLELRTFAEYNRHRELWEFNRYTLSVSDDNAVEEILTAASAGNTEFTARVQYEHVEVPLTEV